MTTAANSRLAKDKPVTPARIRAFQQKIHTYYNSHGRDLPWRKTRDPYRILVSEIMLQQTQVDRVISKYKDFLALFPDFQSLAKARLKKLLGVWQGMGYNRILIVSVVPLPGCDVMSIGKPLRELTIHRTAGHRQVHSGRGFSVRFQQTGCVHGYEYQARVHS